MIHTKTLRGFITQRYSAATLAFWLVNSPKVAHLKDELSKDSGMPITNEQEALEAMQKYLDTLILKALGDI